MIKKWKKYYKGFNWESEENYKGKRFSKEFLEEFKNKINWGTLCRVGKLSEDLIEEFQDKVDWDYVFFYQKLSESFIRKFIDKLDPNKNCCWSDRWKHVFMKQKLSPEFKTEYWFELEKSFTR